MKILHLISQTPDYTGSGKYIREIIRHARKAGHDNFLVAGVQDGFRMDEDILPRSSVLFVRFDGRDIPCAVPGMSDAMPYESTIFSQMPASLLDQYRHVFRKRINQAVDRFKPDLIHSHHLWIVSAVAREAAPHLPMVTTCHGTCLRQFALCPGIGSRISPVLNRIDQVLALSRHQFNEIQTVHGIDQNKITVVGIGYNHRLFYHEPRPFSGTVRMVYAGKLSRSKGVPWLLSALNAIRNEPFVLHVAGDGVGSEKDLCLEKGKALGDKAVFHGALSHEELSRLMRQSHLFVLPSFYEGFPLVIMEALASGCRTISTALPGIREMLKGTGSPMIRLIDLPALETVDAPFDADMPMLESRLAGIISEMIREIRVCPDVDPGSIAPLISEYTWEKVFQRIERVYRKAVNHPV